MSDRATLKSWLVTRLQDDDSLLTSTDQDDALDAAIWSYSLRRPRRGLHTVTGDGSTTDFALPSDWVTDFSRLIHVESPIGEVPMELVDPASYSLVWATVASTPPDITQQLRFVSALASGKQAQLLYTRLHVAYSDWTSISTAHQRAVATLGAAIGLEWMSTNRARQSASSIGADTSDHAGRSDRYATRARAMRDEFDRMVPKPGHRRMQVVR